MAHHQLCRQSERKHSKDTHQPKLSHAHHCQKKTNNHLLKRITSHPHCQIRICCRHTELKVQSSSLFMTCRSHFWRKTSQGGGKDHDSRERLSTRVYWEKAEGDLCLTSYVVPTSEGVKNVLVLSINDAADSRHKKDDGKKKPAVF